MTTSDMPPGTRGRGPFCSECGASLPATGSFCPSCGAAVAAPGYPTAPAPSADASHRRTVRHGQVGAAVVVILALLGVGAGMALARRGPENQTTPLVASKSATATTATPAAAPSPATPAVTTLTATPSSAVVPSQTFADLYQRVNSGVVRIESTTCDGGGIGTGFLIAPNLIATVAHVVSGAAALSLTLGDNASGGTTSGTVVGIDPQSDLALVRTNRPLTGHVFTLADHAPIVGQEIGAIGFPEGEPMTLTRGIVSGLERTVPINGLDRSGLIQTDVAINPGNSGGPMLATDGQVYGLIDAKRTDAAGIGYAVSPTTANARLGAWKGSTTSVVTSACARPVAPGPARTLNPTLPPASDPQTVAVTGALKGYFDAINAADYGSAWRALGPSIRGPSPDSLAAGLATTYDGLVVVHSVSSAPSGAVLAHVTFTSVQALGVVK